MNKNRKTNNNNKQSSFLLEYKWWVIIPLVLLIVAYVMIYLCFLGRGFLPTGEELDKKDWLSFLGAYLGLAGTLFISLIAILQVKVYSDRDEKRLIAERKKVVQPILSVNIAEIDAGIIGTTEAFNPYDPKSFPRHKNVTIEIENVGQFPIINVIVFDQYLWQMLKTNEKKTIQIAYSDSPDVQHWKDLIIELFEDEYERTDEGIPKSFNVQYDDIDGNEMYQTFELKDFEGTKYYSLEGTHDI